MENERGWSRREKRKKTFDFGLHDHLRIKHFVLSTKRKCFWEVDFRAVFSSLSICWGAAAERTKRNVRWKGLSWCLITSLLLRCRWSKQWKGEGVLRVKFMEMQTLYRVGAKLVLSMIFYYLCNKHKKVQHHHTKKEREREREREGGGKKILF